MRFSILFAAVAVCLCACAGASLAADSGNYDNDPALLQLDGSAFSAGKSGIEKNPNLLDADFSWTNSSGIIENKSDLLRDLHSGKGLPVEPSSNPGNSKILIRAITARGYGTLGVVQSNDGKLFVLRVWVKKAANWKLLAYHAVSIGAPPSTQAGNEACENPCKTVPFQPRTEAEREVIGAYQAVERAVTAHDSAAWGGAHRRRIFRGHVE